MAPRIVPSFRPNSHELEGEIEESWFRSGFADPQNSDDSGQMRVSHGAQSRRLQLVSDASPGEFTAYPAPLRLELSRAATARTPQEWGIHISDGFGLVAESVP